MKKVLLGLLFAGPFLAHATPGDTGCVASYNGKEVEVVAQKRDSGEVFKIVVNVDQKEIASFDTVTTGPQALPVNGEPKTFSVTTGSGDAGYASINIGDYEGAQDKDTTITAIIDSAELAVVHVKAVCQF